MPRNSSGAVRPGRRSFAIHGGAARITESSALKLLLRPVEVERDGAFPLEADRPEAVAEPDRRASRGEKSRAPDR